MIRLKDPNNIYNIETAARSAAESAAYSLTGQPLNQAISSIVAAAVKAGIQELMNQQYTDEDFERDIGLKT